jgi:hypothetical protein
MMAEIQIKRYAAFYRGWCQAFGEHEGEIEEGADINWIYGEGAIGLVMSKDIQKRFMRYMLLKGGENPGIELRKGCIYLNDEKIVMASAADRKGLSRIRALFGSGLLIHMYLTSHFYYPSGTRIITFSTRKPLPIVYKEINPVSVRLSE